MAAAKAVLDKDAKMAEAQSVFFPYLTGYIAFYFGDYKTALADLEKASQNDPFIQCLLGETYEENWADKDKADGVLSGKPPATYRAQSSCRVRPSVCGEETSGLTCGEGRRRSAKI